MVTIRREKLADIEEIRKVNTVAFERPGEADAVDKIREAGGCLISLVAEVDGKIVGHILFSPVIIKHEDNIFNAMGLAPMAVLPEFQRQGIGSELVRHGLDECRKLGEHAILVVGYPEYYPRFGFKPASNFGIKYEGEVPNEAFMGLELSHGAFDNIEGTAYFRPEFKGL